MFLLADAELEVARLAVEMRLALGDERVHLSVAHSRLDFDLELLLLRLELHVRAVVAHLLLRHLEAARSQRLRLHLHAAVALAGPRRGSLHRLVSYHL